MLLSTSNTYGGGTTVNVGALAATSPGALPNYNVGSKVTVNTGGMLTLSVGGSGWLATSAGSLLNANGTGFASGSTLGLDTTNANFTYGVITGNMGLAKLGVNTLTLTGNSTFAGPTLISGGTLQLGDGSGHDGSVSGVITNNASQPSITPPRNPTPASSAAAAIRSESLRTP